MVYRLLTGKGYWLVGILSCFLSGYCHAQDGKALFQSNCAQCHNPVKVVTGPALKGVTDRVPDRKLLHDWIRNNTKVLAAGNVYFNNLFNQYGRAPMNTFPGLSDAEIDAILSYVDQFADPLAAVNTSTYPSAAPEDHTVLFGVVASILAIFALGLYLVNSNLKKLADEKKGMPPSPLIPFYRRRSYIALTVLVLCLLLGYGSVELAMGLGRSKNYQPVQPIFFSHKVHAGLNQISCLFCHGDAREGRQAGIPSPNICMNCHAAINEYRGERLLREDGTRVNPNEELARLFSHTGYDPARSRYTHAGYPIEWVRVHRLPDHVFFSHAQHVLAGKVQCQTCHGPVQEMNEVRQFTDLSMGWCINCHRTSRVDFADSSGAGGNRFYRLYTRLTEELRTGKIDSVTVEKIGGTECQKCHY